MREVLLSLAILAICAWGFIEPLVGLFGYVWFALMRPDVIAWSTRPFSFILAVLTLGLSWRYLAYVGPNLLFNPISRILLLQQIPVALSVFAAYSTALAIPMYERYIRLMLMVILIPLMVTNERRLRALIFVIVFSMGAIAAKFGVWSAIHGGVVIIAGSAGMYGDTNGIALAMGILVPLAIYARELTENKIVKLTLLGIVGCAVITTVMCGSRGNMLSLMCTGMLMISRSKYKLVGAFAVIILALPAVYLAGSRLSARLESVANYEDDRSAASRLDFWKAAIQVAKDYPILGVGYGEDNYVEVSKHYLGADNGYVVHNSYLQMLVDCGVFEFLLYVGSWWGTMFYLGRSAKRMQKLKPEWRCYPLALQTSLLHFALAQTFYSRADFEFAYIVLMTAAAWYSIEKIFLREHSAVQQIVVTPVFRSPEPALAGRA